MSASFRGTALALRGILLVVPAMEEVQWLQLTVTQLTRMIATGALASGLQKCVPLDAMCLLSHNVEGASRGPLLVALAPLGRVCFPHVGKTAFPHSRIKPPAHQRPALFHHQGLRARLLVRRVSLRPESICWFRARSKRHLDFFGTWHRI